MRRDDVRAALDVLASAVATPLADAASTVARGRRRIRRRRVTLAGIVGLLAAITLVAGVIASADDSGAPRVTSVPTTNRSIHVVPQTTTTTPQTRSAFPPSPVAFASDTEGWVCGSRSFIHTTTGFDRYRNGTSSIVIPTATASERNEITQPPLCAVAPGGNVWLLRSPGSSSSPEVLHIRSTDRKVSTYPFAPIDQEFVTDLAFANEDDGWALVAPVHSLDRALYRTNDGGATWALLVAHVPIFGNLRFTGPDNGWATGDSALMRTSDGGLTWQSVDTPVLPPVAPVLATVDTVVARGERSTGMMVQPFFDISVDGGTTWRLARFSPDVQVPGTLPHPMVAADADHLALAVADRLYSSDDGGENWTLHNEFAGLQQIDYLAYPTPDVIVVSGIADPANGSTAVLASSDGGETWATVTFDAPPLEPDAPVVNWPGGIIGCPTHPLTPPPPGDPPAGLVSAAETYAGAGPDGWAVGSIATYRVGDTSKGQFGSLFKFHVESCGPATMGNAWVVELHSNGIKGQAYIPRAYLALAHSTDGWHVFGRYP